MEGTTYRPVLPDDMADLACCVDTNQHANDREAFVLARNIERQKQSRENAKKAAEPPANTNNKEATVKLSNNRVLTIGLIIVVIFLIIIIAIQIIRHRKAQAEINESNNADQQNQIPLPIIPDKTHGGGKDTQPKPRKDDVIDDNTLQQYMRKTPQSTQPRKSAMETFNDKNNINEKEQLSTIIEDNDDEPDLETARMRETINSILHEKHVDDEMRNGDYNIVGAHVIVMGEMNRRSDAKKDVGAHIVLDEALTDDNDSTDRTNDADADAGADVYDNDNDADDDDENIDAVSGKCTFILISGKRQGQICSRKCADKQTRCINHKDK